MTWCVERGFRTEGGREQSLVRKAFAFIPGYVPRTGLRTAEEVPLHGSHSRPPCAVCPCAPAISRLQYSSPQPSNQIQTKAPLAHLVARGVSCLTQKEQGWEVRKSHGVLTTRPRGGKVLSVSETGPSRF